MSIDISQQPQEKILSGIFTSRARVAILRLFMLDPTRTYYQRQIEAATGFLIRGVQRELERLTDVGMLYRRVEGNRTYYQVDTQFPLFPELRSMVLKTGTTEEQLRGGLAVDETVRLVFLCPAENRVLVVAAPDKHPGISVPAPYTFEIVSTDAFLAALTDDTQSLHPFLAQGVDLLGRRDDPIWHQIETAGFAVQKGKDVP